MLNFIIIITIVHKELVSTVLGTPGMNGVQKAADCSL